MHRAEFCQYGEWPGHFPMDSLWLGVKHCPHPFREQGIRLGQLGLSINPSQTTNCKKVDPVHIEWAHQCFHLGQQWHITISQVDCTHSLAAGELAVRPVVSVHGVCVYERNKSQFV